MYVNLILTSSIFRVIYTYSSSIVYPHTASNTIGTEKVKSKQTKQHVWPSSIQGVLF